MSTARCGHLEAAGPRGADRGGGERQRRRRRGDDVCGPRAQREPGPPRGLPRLRGLRAAGRAALQRIVDEARRGVAGHAAGRAPPHRPAGDRRSQHRHRGGLAAPRRRVRGVPIRDRAREADRADLEARALRRRRRVAGGRHRRPRRRGGAAEPSASHARDRPALRPAARPGRRRRAGARRRRPRDRADGVAALVATMPALGEYERTMSVARERRLFADVRRW